MARAVSTQPLFAPHPLALLAAATACGILLARLLAPPLPLVMGCVALLSLLPVYLFARRRQLNTALFVTFAFIGAGWSLALIEKRSSNAPNRIEHLFESGVLQSGAPVEVEGVLTAAPEPAPDSFYLTLRVEKIRLKETEQAATGVVWLSAPLRDAFATAQYTELELRYGARVRVMTALSRDESFRNPGVSSLTEYLEQRGYDAKGVIKSPWLVERLEDERVFLPLAWLYEWRQRILAEIGARFQPTTAGVLSAALLGNRYNLSRGAAERFREGGTFHVLVISGLHITFIAGIVMLFARRLTRRRGWQFTLAAICLWAYTVAVGAEASVVRASLMFTVVALAPLLHRRASSLNALGAAALILLLWRPSDLFDPSLQLTFLSVLMIVALAWPLLQRLEEVGSWRPTRAAPYPPRCPRWWRTLAELLFWSERQWKLDLARLNYRYRLFKNPLAARLERMRVQRFLRYAIGALLVSACVQLGLLPLLILYFHRLSLASFILNIAVGALMATLSIIALAALLLFQLSARLASPFIWLAENINWLMIHSVDPFARLHLASVRLPEYSGGAALIYALYYLPLLFLISALANFRPLRPIGKDEELTRASPYGLRLAAVALALLLLVIVLHPLSAGRTQGRLRVDFLDVGQGDAALLTMPDGTTLLIDGGGRPAFRTRRTPANADEDEEFERDTRSIGEAVVSEYLWWRGLDQVDYLLATHADADHIDGLSDVARSFGVRAALVARSPRRDPEYQRFAANMRAEGVPVQLMGRGDSLRFGAVVADVLWPGPNSSPDAASANNDSIVIRVRFNERTLLLTGDIEREAEAALISAQDALACDVVKVAHHGSKTSSTASFISTAHPSLAIISVGLSSPYGHPHAGVLERWRASGARVLTTGESGTITVSTDGRDLQVETFVKQ